MPTLNSIADTGFAVFWGCVHTKPRRCKRGTKYSYKMTKFIKNFLMLAVIAGAMVLTGCIKKDAATINVKVVNKLTMPQANVQVYMYSGNISDELLKNKVNATTNIATDENGVATFEINSLSFGVASDQATFIFETFDEDGNVTGKVPTTVKKGGSKDVTLSMNVF